MIIFLIFVIEALLAVMGSFVVGYFFPTRWARVKGYDQFKLVVLVSPAIRVIQWLLYVAIAVTAGWLLHPLVEWMRNPADPADEVGLMYILALGAPASLHVFVVRSVMDWANWLSAEHLRDEDIKVLRRTIDYTDKVSVLVRPPRRKGAVTGAR
ncbi:MAG: hypothetical protein LBH36_00130 [Candidatus Nomurabacteria bacterium]|jgi:hypothetical protein|nr:hypothetical protein [Candidatus Nomurabacteria bacterium]